MNQIFNRLITVAQGVVMGIAEVIPGVSGSTFALVMGIYDDFIDLLHNFAAVPKTIVKIALGKSEPGELAVAWQSIDWRFAISLLIGMIGGFLVFALLVSDLVDTYPQFVFALFMGLILGSITLPWARIVQPQMQHSMVAMISAAVMFLLVGLPAADNSDPHPLMLFVGGVLAVSGLVLPGVSGSFILLVLGLYEYALTALKALLHGNISTSQLVDLSILATGMIAGFIGFISVLKYALRYYPDLLMSILTGIMIGSLRALWPIFQLNEDGSRVYMMIWEFDFGQLILCVLLIGLGLGIVMMLKRSAVRELTKLP